MPPPFFLFIPIFTRSESGWWLTGVLALVQPLEAIGGLPTQAPLENQWRG